MMLYNDVSKSNLRKNIKYETIAATAITRKRCRLMGQEAPPHSPNAPN